MKQRITLEQLLELSPKGKKSLYKWWKLHWTDVIYDIHNPKMGVWQYISNHATQDATTVKRDGLLPILSIGQMIEFLDDHTDRDVDDKTHRTNPLRIQQHADDCWEVDFKGCCDTLCDALWIEVKRHLELK